VKTISFLLSLAEALILHSLLPSLSLTFKEKKVLTFILFINEIAQSSAGDSFDGSATGIMWAYHTLAEYCEVNSQDGYQAGEDTLLGYTSWNQATWNNVQAGVSSDVSNCFN
jgi:hypothetical protein